MDILLLLALIWGYNNQPKDADPVSPVATSFNQAVGFECQSNCTPATSTTIVSADSSDMQSQNTSTEADIIAELESMPVTTTVTATTTTTGTVISTVTSTGT